MPTIQLPPGSTPQQFDVADLSDAQIQQQRADVKTQFDSRYNQVYQGCNPDSTKLDINGISCKIYTVKDDKFTDRKKAALAEAIAVLRAHAFFALPDSRLDVYCHTKQVCLGYLMLKGGSPRAVMFLGSAVHEKGNSLLVHDAIYDYYKPTFSVNALQKRMMTAIFHEFGHIYHQIKSPSLYFALGGLGYLKDKACLSG